MSDQLPFEKMITGQSAAPAPVPPQTHAEPPKPEEKKKRLILPYILLAVFFLTLLPGPLFFVALFMPGPMKEPTTIIIPRGSSVASIAELLDKNDVLINPYLFRAVSRLMANDSLQAGEYQFTPGQTVLDITVMLHDGKTVVRQFTAAEGLTSQEIVALIKNIPALSGDIEKMPEEGTLLPETYRYSLGDTRQAVIERMQKDMKVKLAELWEKRDPTLPLKSPRDALILASIVEKETGKQADERPMVAQVFYNRLRAGMPLQTDPTVIYALTNGKGPLGRALSRADLTIASPYNTYVVGGLPPGPICNPGLAALEAVFFPAKHDFLYFVANGTGGHSFAKTLEEHNRNVSKWLNLNHP